jgi:ATP-dependent exoDNAse (exonuclease V) beta subunit
MATEGALRLVDASDRIVEKSRARAIKFATIQAFKGMESPVVILCDADQVSDSEPQALLYVAMSRARSQLIIFAHERVRAAIADCIKRKLQAQWKVGQ